MRAISFFLNNYDYRIFIRGGEARFIQVSRHLKTLGVDFYALEYESSNSSHFEPLGYYPVKIPINLKNAVLNAFLSVLYAFVICVRKRCEIVYVPGRFSWNGGKWVGVIAPYIISVIFQIPLVILFHHIQPWAFKEKNPLTLRAYRRARGIAVSKATADDMRRIYGISNIRLVGNGVETRLYSEMVVNSKEYHAAFLGRVEENKGVYNLARAWKVVVEKKPDAQLILIGPIRDEVKDKLNELLTEFELINNVTVTGYVSEEKKTKILKSSMIFVFPSKIEGFGLVVLEAMASELPCILSEISALREIFSDYAIFVQPNDINQLAIEIMQLLDDKRMQVELIEKGKKLAHYYSWENVALNEYNQLKEILSERNRLKVS